MTRYRLRIADELCWGCQTCEVACKAENGAPTGVKLIRVDEDGPFWKDDELQFLFRVKRCRQCGRPKCVDACPVAAIAKRDDGIVVLDEDLCDGCRACMEACPYDAIAFDDARGVATKCNLCHHRIDEGLLPACADNVCLAHCIHLAGAEVGSRPA
jgi:Fe-S-cluster-containing dehydrogenase component